MNQTLWRSYRMSKIREADDSRHTGTNHFQREPMTPDARLLMRFCGRLQPEEQAFIRSAMKARAG